MDSIIATASTTFVAATGFAWSDVVTYTGNLIKLVIGTGLGTLNSSMGWIVALLAISAILYLLFKAFKFFHFGR